MFSYTIDIKDFKYWSEDIFSKKYPKYDNL